MLNNPNKKVQIKCLGTTWKLNVVIEETGEFDPVISEEVTVGMFPDRPIEYVALDITDNFNRNDPVW